MFCISAPFSFLHLVTWGFVPSRVVLLSSGQSPAWAQALCQPWKKALRAQCRRWGGRARGGLGNPWACSAQQNANCEDAGKIYKYPWCREAAGRALFLGEGGEMCCRHTAPSDSSEGWVSTGPAPSGARAGSAALPLLPVSSRDGACARRVRAWDWWELCACVCSHAHRVCGRVQ